MNDILCGQLALDYCCGRDDVLDGANHFTVFEPLEGRRRFQNDGECWLKIAAVNGKLLFSGESSVIRKCEERFGNASGEWFFEAKWLRKIDELLRDDGYMIKFVHPFFISDTVSRVDTEGFQIRMYEGSEIERFRGDDRFGEAFAFCDAAPDMIGIAAVRDGDILGMAGASCDSPTMWQIGIDVVGSARRAGIGTMLVALLKNEVLKRGKLPFYGTALSHITSQRTALGAGFLPAWAELAVTKM